MRQRTGPVLIAVDRIEQFAVGHEHPRLDWHLENWAYYMRAGGTKKLVCNVTSMWSRTEDFDSMCDRMEVGCAITVDALITDLSPVEQSSIYHRHLHAVYRTNREPMEVVYARARAILSAALIRKGIS